MKLGIIILCRYDSSRLPGKILMPLQGKPILQYILERIEQVVDLSSIVVATSDEISDDPVFEYCQRNGINCFRGSKENVAKRFLECAEEYKFDFFVRINGDNLFVDSEILRTLLNIASTGNYDFISNVKGRTFPKGMSIEVVSFDFYRSAYERFDKSDHFEHVTIFFYQHENLGRQYHYINHICPEAAGIQLAIDTVEDFERAASMIARMERSHTEYHLTDIWKLWKDVEDEKRMEG